MRRIDVDEARRLMDAGATVIDVLPEPTYRAVHLPGAINHPLATMTAESVSAIDRDTPLVVYCYDQRCDLSARASARLEHLGFTQVHDLIGGRAAWTVLDLPTEGQEADRRRVSHFVRPARTVPVDGTIGDIDSPGGDANTNSPAPIAVLDEDGVLLGALAPTALALAPSTRVADVMVPAPGTIRPDLTVDDALEQIERDGLGHTFVSTARGELVGLLFRQARG